MMGFRDRFDRNKRKKSTRTQRIGFALFWLLVLSFAYFVPLLPNFNSESHLYLTFSLVDHHSVNIDPYQVRLGDKSYFQGHYYSDKAPGVSFLGVAPYAAMRAAMPDVTGQPYQAYSRQRYAIARNTIYIRYAITYLLLIMPSALFAVLLWLFLSKIIGDQRWALVLTAVYSLGTIAWTYSVWLFSHQIAAMLLFGSFLAIYYRVAHGTIRPKMDLFAALAGLLAGYAVICEYPTIVIAALLGVYLLAVARHRLRAALAFIAGMLPPAALAMVYNTAAFGKPFALGYSHVRSAMYNNSVHTGIFGLANPAAYGVRAPSLNSLWQITFGTYRGIFLVSPVLLLFFAGLVFMYRRREVRAEFWLCAGVVCLYFLMDASRGVDQNGWSGGWAVASRHLTPMLPFMIVPMAFGIRSINFRRILVGLGALSIAMMFMIVAIGAQFTSTDQNPLVNEMLRDFLTGKIQFSWGQLLGLQGYLSLAPYLLLAAGLVVRIVWLFRHVEEPAAAQVKPVLALESA